MDEVEVDAENNQRSHVSVGILTIFIKTKINVERASH